MRISDLSRQTGVPVATIKFYLREHLLPPGIPTGRNQAIYSKDHLRRLQLIRAFTNIARLDLASVRSLLSTIKDEQLDMRKLYELVNRTLFPEEPALGDIAGLERTRADVDKFIDKLGWQSQPDTPGRVTLARGIAALQGLGCDCGTDFLIPYAEAAERLAAHELDLLPPDGAEADRAAAVARSVLLEVALTSLRRMAQQHHVTLRFGQTPAGPQPDS